MKILLAVLTFLCVILPNPAGALGEAAPGEGVIYEPEDELIENGDADALVNPPMTDGLIENGDALVSPPMTDELIENEDADAPYDEEQPGEQDAAPAAGRLLANGDERTVGTAGDILNMTATPEEWAQVACALADYEAGSECAIAVENSIALVKELLNEEAGLERMGAQSNADQLRAELEALISERNKWTLSMQKCAVTVKDITGVTPENYDLTGIFLATDPLTLDFEALGVEGAKTEALDLEIGYEDVLLCVARYKKACGEAQAAAGDYERALADKASYSAKLSAQYGARAKVYEALCAYSKMLYNLNLESGGTLMGMIKPREGGV